MVALQTPRSSLRFSGCMRSCGPRVMTDTYSDVCVHQDQLPPCQLSHVRPRASSMHHGRSNAIFLRFCGRGGGAEGAEGAEGTEGVVLKEGRQPSRDEAAGLRGAWPIPPPLPLRPA